MRTLGKWLLSSLLAVLALLATVLAIFLFNEKWQVQVVDAVLEESTGWQWDFSSVNLGWNHFRAADIFAMRGAEGFEIGEAKLEPRMFSLVGGDPIVIGGGYLQDCFLDLSTFSASALGFSERELARTPSPADARSAVERLVELSLQRLQAQGLMLEIRDLRIDGTILLPQQRSLAFDVNVSGTTQDPQNARVTVTRVEFR